MVPIIITTHVASEMATSKSNHKKKGAKKMGKKSNREGINGRSLQDVFHR